MSTLGLTVTFVAAGGWALLDAARKSMVRRVDPVPLLVWLALGQLPLFVGWAAWDARWFAAPSAYAVPGAASVVLNVAANLLYLRAVKVSPLSLVIPLLSFVPVFTVLAANPLLGELPGPWQLAGIVLVVIGALILNADAARNRGALGLVRALIGEPGSLPMLGTALCWSLTIVVDKMATAHASYAAHGVVINAGVGFAVLGWLAIRGKLATLGQVRGSVALLVGAVSAAAVGLGAQLVAIQYLLTSVVESIKRAVGMASSVALGRAFFGEPVTGHKLVAIVAMTIGGSVIVLA